MKRFSAWPLLIIFLLVSSVATSQHGQVGSSPDTSLSLMPVRVEREDTSLFQNSSTKHYSWSTYTLTGKQLLRFPFREVRDYLSFIPGIVEVNGNLHSRGSRAGEIAYLVDGFSVTNPFFNSNGVPLIPEAIEQIELHSGAYGATFGGGNGGFILTQFRRGGDSLKYSLDYRTDEFFSPGKQFLNTTSNGYRNVVATLSGPLPLGVRFFLAAQHNYVRNRQLMFLEPFRYDDLVTDQISAHGPGVQLPGTLEFSRNYLHNNWQMNNSLQGNISFASGPLALQLLVSYGAEEFPEGSQWPVVMENYYRQKRNMMNESITLFGGLRGRYAINENISLSAAFSYYDRFARLYDQDFGDDWQLYADSASNAKKGYTGFTSKYIGPQSYSTIFNFRFRDPHSPNNFYRKNNQNGTTASLDVKASPFPGWNIEAGAITEIWSLRTYRVENISYFLSNAQHSYRSDNERRVRLIRSGSIDNFGYDFLGNKVDEGFDAPRTPSKSTLYINNEIKHDGVALNFGGRYEIHDSGVPVLPMDDIVADTYGDYTDMNLVVVDENRFKERKPTGLFLPRVSLSYQRSPENSFYIAFGRYAQFSPLNLLHTSNMRISQAIAPFYRVPYWLPSGFRFLTPGFFAEPEQTTQVEFGGSHPVGERFLLSMRLYYKVLKNQLQLGKVKNFKGDDLFVAFLNQGFGESRGVEVQLELLRTQNRFVLLNYTFSDARGVTSHPTWNAREVSDFPPKATPQSNVPFDYDQTHSGSVLINVTFEETGGRLLEGVGVTSVISFNSGHRYTRLEEMRFMGCSASPWNVGVRSLIDPRVAIPRGDINSATTPAYLNVDLKISKLIDFGFLRGELYVDILNLFNRKHVLNVYPVTGRADHDGWMSSFIYQSSFSTIPRYAEFYNLINHQNRWAYMLATGNDLYGMPRHLRIGLKLEM